MYLVNLNAKQKKLYIKKPKHQGEVGNSLPNILTLELQNLCSFQSCSINFLSIYFTAPKILKKQHRHGV
jgi:hypothetical protein